MASAQPVKEYLKKNNINLGSVIGGVEIRDMETAGLSPEDIKKYVKNQGLSFKAAAEEYLNNSYKYTPPANDGSADNQFGIQNDFVGQGQFPVDNFLEDILGTPAEEGSERAIMKNEIMGNVVGKYLDQQYRHTNADLDASRGLTVREAELNQDRSDYLQRSEVDSFFNAVNQSNEFTLQNEFEFNRAQERLTELGLEADLQGNLRKLDGDQNRLTQDNAARNQIDLEGVKGVIAKTYMLEELAASGLNDRELQHIIENGAFNRIVEQGKIDTTIAGMDNETQKIIADLNDKGHTERLNLELRSNEGLAELKGQQALQQIELELTKIGANEQTLQGLRDKGAIEQILEQGYADIDVLQAQAKEDYKLQDLIDGGALTRLNVELQGNKDIQRLVGDQAMAQLQEELRGVGFNERELQGLVNDGVIDQIIKQGDVDDKLLVKNIANEQKLQSMIDDGSIERLRAEIRSNETIQKMKGVQAERQIALELRDAGINDRLLEELRSDGLLKQIDAQGNVDIRKITKELELSGVNEKTLERVRNSSALQQIGAQGIVDIDKIGAEGDVQLDILDAQGRIDIDKIELELRKSGVNDRQLERLRNKGVLEQIRSQGDVDIDKITQELELSGINEQTLANINNSGVLQQIKAQQKADIAVQKLVGGQSVEQIQEQGKVDVSKIGATSVADQARIITQSEADERLIKAQNLADTTLENIKSTNRQSETSLVGNIESRQIQEKGDVEESRISAQGLVDKTLQGMVGNQAVEQIGAKGDQDVRKTKVAGDDTRKTLELENKLKSKDRANQSGYARNLAGMM